VETKMNVEKPLMTRQEIMDLLRGREPKPEPKPPVVRLAVVQEFGVEVQRERTLRELRALERAERRERGFVPGTIIYYRELGIVLGRAQVLALKR
jgi:hypothetical protein